MAKGMTTSSIESLPEGCLDLREDELVRLADVLAKVDDNWDLMVIETEEGAEIWRGTHATRWPHELEKDWLIATFGGPNIALNWRQQWLADLARLTVLARRWLPFLLDEVRRERRRTRPTLGNNSGNRI